MTLANQTNLSLKGVLGVAAMARISYAVGNLNDSLTYQVRIRLLTISLLFDQEILSLLSKANATSLIEQWQSFSTSEGNDRLLGAFQQQDSGGLIYNLYADKLLNLSLIPESVRQVRIYSYYLLSLSPRTDLRDANSFL